MPNGWNVYYVVFLSAGLAVGIPALLVALSSIRNRRRNRQMPRSSGVLRPAPTILGRKMNPRFFLGVNVAFILITLAMALIPPVGSLQRGISRGEWLLGLLNILLISLFMALGLFYAARKGDLSWLRTFQKKDHQSGTVP